MKPISFFAAHSKRFVRILQQRTGRAISKSFCASALQRKKDEKVSTRQLRIAAFYATDCRVAELFLNIPDQISAKDGLK